MSEVLRSIDLRPNCSLTDPEIESHFTNIRYSYSSFKENSTLEKWERLGNSIDSLITSGPKNNTSELAEKARVLSHWYGIVRILSFAGRMDDEVGKNAWRNLIECLTSI